MLKKNDPLDRFAAKPHKRSRQWEKRHQNHKAVYRGVDPKLALRVKSIAGDLRVPEGEVARALIEYALCRYERGELELCPRPNPYRLRMTLFPISASAQPAKHKQSQAAWRVITTWRGFPPDLKKELTVLACADGLNVPVGELITALLRCGLRAYNDGWLTLEPDSKKTAAPNRGDTI